MPLSDLLNIGPKGYFITGTDTGVGKTYVSLALIRTLKAAYPKRPVIGLKPVSSGCEITPEGLRNEDAMQLQAESSLPLSYQQINPYAFEPPIAPHIAAQQVGVTLSVSDLLAKYQALQQQYPQALWVVEGVGGWSVPLNAYETMGDFARALNLPVILVVDMKLGCLNHALLTGQALQSSGLPIAGWVANQATPQKPLAYEENLATLKEQLRAPLLKIIPHSSSTTLL